jgi:hypothetical protein
VIWRLLEPFVTWAYNTSISEWIRASQWAVAVLEVFHLFGLIFLLGSSFMIALRAFGIVMKDEPVNRVVLNLAPATIGGALLMTITGTLIFSSGATRYIDSPSFQVKMVFYLFAFLMQCAVYIIALRKRENDRRLSPLWMVIGGLALLLWFGVGIAGRAIAFI